MQPNRTAERIIAAVPCPTCHAEIGATCRNFLRAIHPERSAAYLALKRASVDATRKALAEFRPAPFAARAPGQEAQFVVDETDGPQRTVEVWQEGEHVATLTVRTGVLRIQCAPAWNTTVRTEGPTGAASNRKFVTTPNLRLDLQRDA